MSFDSEHCWTGPVQGTDVTDEELLEYISESSTMSKAMDEYDGESPPSAHCLRMAHLSTCRWLPRFSSSHVQ